MAIQSTLFACLVVAASSACFTGEAIVADMHDGDKKKITVSSSGVTIVPFGNDQKWVVKTELDQRSCSAIIDFDVPGKPGVPPVNLTATLFSMHPLSGHGHSKLSVEFSDPSGTIAAPSDTVNEWVQIGSTTAKSSSLRGHSCWSGSVIVADMHDGDQKKWSVTGSDLTIVPHNNNQTWVVKSKINSKSCSAIIDFNVPGKPGVPPVDLTATLFSTHAQTSVTGIVKLSVEFTDPSGTIAPAGYPVNEWIQKV